MQRYASGRSQGGPSQPQSGPHTPEHVHRAFHITLEPDAVDELADVPSALHSYFQSLVLSQQGRLDHIRSALPCPTCFKALTTHSPPLRVPALPPHPSLMLSQQGCLYHDRFVL